MTSDTGATIAARPESTAERMRELRRTFHRRPELAYEEVETARTVMAELERLGIPYDYGGKGGGVVGHLAGPGAGPRIALRAEMDALPCTEETGLPFASATPGRMHACGHDAPHGDRARRGGAPGRRPPRPARSCSCSSRRRNGATAHGSWWRPARSTGSMRSSPATSRPSTGSARSWSPTGPSPPTRTASASRCTARAGTAHARTKPSTRWSSPDSSSPPFSHWSRAM